jgi:SPX domain protein involved in polyphosphate accumulation
MRNGLVVKWQYPMQTPVKIDYFQIYFREVLNSTSLAIVSNEWKTTESISAEQDNYYIDEMDLELSRVYEFQMVSFSAFSKSLPSPITRFEFKPTESSK